MTNVNDYDTLITQGEGQVYIDLACGYGQPSVTTIHLKKNDGTTEKLVSFGNNADAMRIGEVQKLKYHAIIVHTTIHDVQDPAGGNEAEDISLKVTVYDTKSNAVDTAFTRKTKGKGAIFHSFYTVTIF